MAVKSVLAALFNPDDKDSLDLFFADAGNVDSTTLLDRIRWES